MEKEHAEKLIHEIQQKPVIIPFAEQTIKDMMGFLYSVELDVTIARISGDPFFLENRSDGLHHRDQKIYLSRIINNRKIKLVDIALKERVLDRFGIHQRDFYTRNFLANPELIHMMRKCPEPYSMIGRIEQKDYYYNHKGDLITDSLDSRMPFIVVPGFNEQVKEIEKHY